MIGSSVGIKGFESVAHNCHGAYPSFEATRNIATPPGWDACPSHLTSQHFVRFP